MMLSEKILTALNDQMNAEFYASHLYLQIAANFEAKSLPGFGSWLRAQSKEEREHAVKIYDFILDRGATPAMGAMEKPVVTNASSAQAFEMVLQHEQKVTSMIDTLYELAGAEQDHPTSIMLQWFITEQVEEEATAAGILDHLKMIGDDPAALLQYDRQMADKIQTT